MNNQQKEKITAMRRKGCTYAKISEETGISVNTIKSYCLRNPLTESNTAVCKNCGEQISWLEHRKPRQFCSDSCRVKYWRKAHPERTVYSLTCQNCGSSFKSKGNRQQKYCSHRCYVADRFGKELSANG